MRPAIRSWGPGTAGRRAGPQRFVRRRVAPWRARFCQRLAGGKRNTRTAPGQRRKSCELLRLRSSAPDDHHVGLRRPRLCRHSAPPAILVVEDAPRSPAFDQHPVPANRFLINPRMAITVLSCFTSRWHADDREFSRKARQSVRPNSASTPFDRARTSRPCRALERRGLSQPVVRTSLISGRSFQMRQPRESRDSSSPTIPW